MSNKINTADRYMPIDFFVRRMMTMKEMPITEQEVIQVSRESRDLAALLDGPKYRKYGRFVFAALSSIPWVGGMLGASAALIAENEQGRINDLLRRWLEEHRKKIDELGATLVDMAQRLDQFGDDVEPRLQDEKYLSLVRQGFRVWDEASTDSKRDYVRRTLTNAAATKICSDDVVRMFLAWIEQYDESHFQVVRALFFNRGATRGLIWDEIHGEDVREDSPEADLFKLLIFDLSTGHVLRQIREKNSEGEFLVKRRTRRSQFPRTTVESAFEDTKPYELTALGQQFVTYVLNETVPRIG
jgi:hypothetical protein